MKQGVDRGHRILGIGTRRGGWQRPERHPSTQQRWSYAWPERDNGASPFTTGTPGKAWRGVAPPPALRLGEVYACGMKLDQDLPRTRFGRRQVLELKDFRWP